MFTGIIEQTGTLVSVVDTSGVRRITVEAPGLAGRLREGDSLGVSDVYKRQGVTGIVLTKLDGTAKGGIAVAIAQELGLPVCFVGVGEKMTDLLEFSPAEFVDSLLE